MESAIAHSIRRQRRKLSAWACAARGVVIPLLGGMFMLTVGGVFAQQSPLPEDQIKAAYLVNFAKYVDWPADAGDTNRPLVIGIVGETRVREELKAMLPKVVNGRPVSLQQIQPNAGTFADCQIVFIADSERRRLSTILEKLKGQSVLTVGECDEFLEKGGMINLAHRDRKIRLEVNLEATRKEQLEVSSKLLGVAEVVKGRSK